MRPDWKGAERVAAGNGGVGAPEPWKAVPQ